MRVEVETGSYNQRRYGKPWIARVTLSGTKLEMEWGNWIGSPGYPGISIVECAAGDVVATGQKDNRGNKSDRGSYHVVDENGTLGPGMDRVDAYKHLRSRQ